MPSVVVPKNFHEIFQKYFISFALKVLEGDEFDLKARNKRYIWKDQKMIQKFQKLI